MKECQLKLTISKDIRIDGKKFEEVITFKQNESQKAHNIIRELVDYKMSKRDIDAAINRAVKNGSSTLRMTANSMQSYDC